jgi:hypothetical protein
MTAPPRPSLREAPYGYTLRLVPGLDDAVARLTDVLWNPDGRVPPRIKELVFLRTSVVNRCET